MQNISFPQNIQLYYPTVCCHALPFQSTTFFSFFVWKTVQVACSWRQNFDPQLWVCWQKMGPEICWQASMTPLDESIIMKMIFRFLHAWVTCFNQGCLANSHELDEFSPVKHYFGVVLINNQEFGSEGASIVCCMLGNSFHFHYFQLMKCWSQWNNMALVPGLSQSSQLEYLAWAFSFQSHLQWVLVALSYSPDTTHLLSHPRRAWLVISAPHWLRCSFRRLFFEEYLSAQ